MDIIDNFALNNLLKKKIDNFVISQDFLMKILIGRVVEAFILFLRNSNLRILFENEPEVLNLFENLSFLNKKI